MKNLFYLGFLLVAVSCNSKRSESENLDWLTGSWIRTNEIEGKETYENWVKISPNEYRGHGYTLQGNDTLSQEFLHMVGVNGDWKLSIKMPQDISATVFNVVELSEKAFKSENKQIDFPQIITYRLENTELHASISNDSLEIPYLFTKYIQP